MIKVPKSSFFLPDLIHAQTHLCIPLVGKLILLTLMAGLLARPAQATHLMGADLTYQIQSITPPCTTYRVFSTIYYDCSGAATTPLPGPPLAPLISFTTTAGCVPAAPLGNWSQLSYLEVTPVCPSIQTRCTSAAGAINGVLESRWFRDYQICGAAAGCQYKLGWSGSARNATITSGAASQDIYVSTSFTAGLTNSSPQFQNIPVPYLCAGDAFTFNQGAIDADGDLLTYALVACNEGPNANVTYNAGYSPANPLGGTWTVAINAATGDITFTPNPGAALTAVLCVEVTETRNGVVIGKVRRDLQVTVITCTGTNNNPQILAATNPGTQTTVVSPYLIQGSACSPVVFDIPTTDPNTGQTYTLTWSQPPTMVNSGASFQSVGLTPIQNNTITASSPPTARFSWTPLQTGTYTFLVTLKDTGCPLIGQNQRTFTVIVAPYLADAGADKTLCAGAATAIGQVVPGAASYAWCNQTLGCPANTTGISGSITGATATVSLTPAIVPPGVTTYTYQMKATHTLGCVATDNVNVTVTTPPTPVCSTAAATVCVGSGLALFNTTAGPTAVMNATSFTWNFGGGSQVAGTNTNPVVAWNTPGVKTITLTATYQGCSLSVSQTITVTALPAATFTMPAPQAYCPGQGVIPTYTGSTPVSQYSWSFGAGASPATSIAAAPSVNWNTSGTKTCSLTVVVNGCTSPVYTVPVTIHPAPSSAFTVPANATCVNAPAQLTYTGTPPAGATYLWSAPGATFNPASPTTSPTPWAMWNQPGIQPCSLVVVSAAGCSSAVTIRNVTISGPPPPAFTLNPNPVCIPPGAPSGSSAMTYTGGLTGLNYLWNFGTTATPATSTAASQNVSWTAPGSYQVKLTVADAGGCQNDNTQIMTVMAPSVVITQSVTHAFLPGGTEATITLNVQNTSAAGQVFNVAGQLPAGVTLISSAPFPFNTAGGNNPMFVAGLSTSTVTLRVRVPSCTMATYCVTGSHQNLSACASSACSILYGGPAGVTTFGQPGGAPVTLSSLIASGAIPATLSAGKYTITGQIFGIASGLIQDVPAHFNQCTWYMMPGSTWNIQALSMANSSTWQGCGGMWRGMRESVDAEISFRDQNTLADAEVGLDMFTQTATAKTKQFSNGTIRNCYIGVRYRHVAGTPLITGKLSLTNTLFTSTLSFLPRYPGQTTAPTTRPLAALWLESMSSYNLNGFRVEKHNAGVYGTQSSFTVQKLPLGPVVQFNDIQQVGVYTAATTGMPAEANGCAIYADGSTANLLTVKGNGSLTSSGYTMNNCRFGVRVRSQTATVENCRMSGMTTGVEVSMLGMPGVKTLTVQNNRIDATSRGVRMLNTENCTFSILNNAISVVGMGGGFAPTLGCIEVQEAALPTSKKSLITGNALTTGGTSVFGIRLNSCVNKLVSLNAPVNLAGATQYGIWLTGGSGNTVYGNTVTGNSTDPTDNQQAFVVSASSGNSLTCNTAENVAYDFHFFGTCTAQDRFEGNTLGDAHVGLRVNAGTTLGTQTHRKNKWTGSYTGDGAQHLGTNAFAWGPSQFFCNDNPATPTGNVLFMPPVVSVGPVVYQMTPTQGWIFSQPGGTSENPCAGLPQFGPGSLDSTYHLLAAGLLQPDIYPDEIRWSMAKDLFALIEADSLITSGDSVMMAYYNGLKTTTLATLTHVVQQYGEVNDETANSDVQALWSGINAVALEIQSLDSLIQSDTTQVAAYQEALDSLYALQSSQTELLTQLSQAQAALWVTDLSVIEGNNNAAAAPEIYEMNWREVNRIYLASLRSGRVSDTEAPVLQSIAGQCPLAGGPAVYTARTLYAHLADDPGYNDYGNCLEQGYQMRPGKGTGALAAEKRQALHVQPNPATETISISLEQPDAGVFTLMSPDGKTVWQQTQARAISLLQADFQQIPSGVYILSFRNESGEVFYTKLCVQ